MGSRSSSNFTGRGRDAHAGPAIQPLEPRVMMAANLLVNGNFSRGAVGFATGYLHENVSLVTSGTFTVGTDPALYHPAGANFGDHTTGTGKMLLINGATSPGKVIWRETVDVVRGVEYDFTGFAASWALTPNLGIGDESPADVQVSINGKPIVTTTLPSAPGQWTSLENQWIATGDKATITLTDLNTALSGNDSAYDDLSFTPLASIHGTVVAARLTPNGKVGKQHQLLPGVVVFLDSNHDGILDAGEPTTVTNKAGNYSFIGLAGGTYTVCQLNPPSTVVSVAQLAVNVPAGKQVAHENVWDIYTAVVPTTGIFK